MTQKLISMTEKELSRYNAIKNLIAGQINGTDAAKQVGLSVRQVKRLKAKVVKNGAQGLIHGHRGRESNRRLAVELVEKAKQILKEKYHDFGPTFASEKLNEKHGIKINKETIRLTMTEMGLWHPKPRKQPKKKHFWRPRKDNYGEMEQFDGSYHQWFGNEETCLLLSVDDATGKITDGQFGCHESVKEVFAFWQDYLLVNGLPLAVYLDKFSTYKVNHASAVDNSELLTQFQRAMEQAGVKLIVAHSPQAKGRIERMFETLQDRLVKELRLAGIVTTAEANEFLKEYIPKFNAQFAVVPARRKNLHKMLNKSVRERLPQIFSIQKERKVNNDYTIAFNNKFYQLDDVQPTTVYKKDAVIVEEHLNGAVKINLKGHYLNYSVLPERPKKEIDIKLPALTQRKPSYWKPPDDHPWRKKFIWNGKNIKVAQTIDVAQLILNVRNSLNNSSQV